MSILPQGSDGFGTDPAIHTQNPSIIQVIHRAEFNNSAWCLGDKARRYLTVLENAIEKNHPQSFCGMPGNCICPSRDVVQKFYYDRGPYDQQGYWFAIGFLNGAPSLFPGEVKYVCCCIEMPECFSNCMTCMSECYWPCCCGERLQYIPADYCCWCCPTRSWWCTNHCGICGVKTGDPLCRGPVEVCLKLGSAAALVVAAENARASWRQRTGKN